MTRYNPPEQEEFERRLRDCFRNGDITNVAAMIGKHRSELSRELNPEEPAKSSIYEAAVMLEGCRAVRPDLFEGIASILLEFIEARRAASLPKLESFDQVYHSGMELFDAHWRKLPYKELLPRLRRHRAMLEQVERALILDDLEDSPEEDSPRSNVREMGGGR